MTGQTTMTTRGRGARAFLIGLVTLSMTHGAIANEAQCFTGDQAPAFPILENAPPPSMGGGNYRFFPVTMAATVRLDTLSRPRPPGVEGVYWQWANHGPRASDGGQKGNITPGSHGVQIRFSSNEAANDCTMAQTEVALGVRRSTLASPLRFETQEQTADTSDVCVLPEGPVANVSAMLLDYEVQDDRPEAVTTAFLAAWANLVRSKGLSPILYTNPWNAPTMRRTGLGANARDVAAHFDLVSILLWSRMAVRDPRQSFEVQSRIAGIPASKAMIVFELMNTSVEDARAVHGLMTEGRAKVLAFWRNRAEVGGSCETPVNRKIACAAFGQCD